MDAYTVKGVVCRNCRAGRDCDVHPLARQKKLQGEEIRVGARVGERFKSKKA